jgi:hypothetical protein
MMHVSAVRFFDMARSAKRYQVCRLEPENRVVRPTFNVVNVQPPASLPAKGAGEVVASFDCGGNLSELVPQGQAFRAHRGMLWQSGTTPLISGSLLGEGRAMFFLKTTAWLRITNDYGIAQFDRSLAAIAAASNLAFSVLAENEQTGKSSSNDGLLICGGRGGGHALKMPASRSETTAWTLMTYTELRRLCHRFSPAVTTTRPLSLAWTLQLPDRGQQTESSAASDH